MSYMFHLTSRNLETADSTIMLPTILSIVRNRTWYVITRDYAYLCYKPTQGDADVAYLATIPLGIEFHEHSCKGEQSFYQTSQVDQTFT